MSTSTPVPTRISQTEINETPTLTGGDDDSADGEMGDVEGSPSRNLVKNLWRTTLWGVLIFAGLVLIGGIIIFVRQRSTKGDEEDLLL